MSIPEFITTSLIAGIFGAGAMVLVMWLIVRDGWAKANMIVAIGSLVTRSRENAFGIGILLHAMSSFVFAMIYIVVMLKFGLSQLPTSFFAGIGFGIVHGLVISLMLVWIVAERHPLVEFQESGLAVGVSHFAGHVAYGAMVGLVLGLSQL